MSMYDIAHSLYSQTEPSGLLYSGLNLYTVNAQCFFFPRNKKYVKCLHDYDICVNYNENSTNKLKQCNHFLPVCCSGLCLMLVSCFPITSFAIRWVIMPEWQCNLRSSTNRVHGSRLTSSVCWMQMMEGGWFTSVSAGGTMCRLHGYLHASS